LMNGNLVVGKQSVVEIANSWVQSTGATGAPALNWKNISVSSTGQYQTATLNKGTNKIYISWNYGIDGWTEKNISDDASKNEWLICVSSSGRYQTAGGPSLSTIRYSEDYGNSWNTSTSQSQLPQLQDIAISFDGLYQTAVSRVQYGTNNRKWDSTDGGKTWNAITLNFSNFPPEVYHDFKSIDISQDGKYQTICNNYDRGIYIS